VGEKLTSEAAFLEAARSHAQHVLSEGDPRDAAMALWKLGFTSTTQFSGGLWQIWGAITDYWTHPQGDAAEGAELARESARELLDVLGDPEKERAYFDRWVERLEIILPSEG
jgi:hypothetical protein